MSYFFIIWMMRKFSFKYQIIKLVNYMHIPIKYFHLLALLDKVLTSKKITLPNKGIQ